MAENVESSNGESIATDLSVTEVLTILIMLVTSSMSILWIGLPIAVIPTQDRLLRWGGRPIT